MTRVAVVDLGSNSTRLLVADVSGDGTLEEFDRRLTITRLGELVDSLGELQTGAISRVRAVLERYVPLIEAHCAERSVAVATSAVRDARNGRSFLDTVEQEFKIDTELLSGQREAALTFRGATQGRTDQGTTLLVDIGGGSTEFVLGSSGEISGSRSLDLGCVRLTERFLEHDPPTVPEITECRSHVRSTLSTNIPQPVAISSALGVAGTATTLATLSLGLDSELPYLVHGHHLSKGWLEKEVEDLAGSPVSELRVRRGIHPDRAPVIVAGALVLAQTLDYFDLDGIEVSENDLLHGVALSLAENTYQSAQN